MFKCCQAVLVIFLSFLSLNLSSQRSVQSDLSKDSYCATVEMNRNLQRQFGIENGIQEFENWLRPKVSEYFDEADRSDEVYTIPVVVHVIHDGDAEDVDENISRDQIYSQITVLNQDFRNLAGTPGESTNAAGADVGIEFCLAQRDPEGKATMGIVRHDLGQVDWTKAQIQSSVKPVTQWDPDKYLNIWVVRFGGADASLGGYAQFPNASSQAGLYPDEGDAPTDGIVINYRTFGSNAGGATYDLLSNYQGGRVCVHEIGHWLGLRHIWGDGDCTYDDYCSDTPISAAANNTCDGSEDSCAGGVKDMVENYMDYTFDNCKNTFTNDQKARLRSVLTNAPRRKSLLNSEACLPAIPTVSLGTALLNIEESTDCNVTTLNVDINLSQSSTAPVDVQIRTSGSAVEGEDYTFSPNRVTFNTGDAQPKTITIEVNNDAVAEGMEQIIFDLVVESTVPAVLTNSEKASLTININDNGDALLESREVVILDEGFENGFGKFTSTGNAGSDKFNIATPGEGSGYFFVIQNSNPTNVAFTNDDNCNCDKNDDRLISPFFSLKNFESATFQFDHAFANYFDFAEVLIAFDESGPWTSIHTISNTSIDYGDGVISTPWNTTVIDLKDHVGKDKVGLAIKYSDLNDWAYGLAIDNFKVTATEKVSVVESVNTINPASFRLNGYETANIYDPSTGDVIAVLENLSDWDYGCLSVEVDNSAAAAGSPIRDFWTTKIEDKILSKTFHIVPEKNKSDGEYKVTWYYTFDEIQDWMNATTHTLSDLQMIKVAETSLNNVNPANWEVYTVENIPAEVKPFGNHYAVTATFNTGFSGFGIGNHDSAPLAVELTAFDARKSNLGQANIFWRTNSESFIDKYEVERSSSGVEFEKIGIISAKNDGSDTDYEFTDFQPLVGKNYYRLKITGEDGDVSYSAIKLLNFEHLGQDELIAFPNPTDEAINLQWFSTSQNNMTIDILSLADGKLISQKNWSIDKGQNYNTISLGQLPSGIYLIRLNGQEFQKYTRVVKR